MISHDTDALLMDHDVLVVDDDPQQLAIYQHMVRNFAGRSHAARNGAEAVACCSSTPCDLILMDLDMPVLDGVAAMATIKTSLTKKPVMIAMTAHADDDLRQRSLAVGAVACLPKPLDFDAVAAVITEHLLGRQATSSHSPSPTTDSYAVFDPQRIDATLDLMGNDTGARQTLRGLITACQQEAPPLIKEATQALQANDLSRIASIAHTLGARAEALGLSAAGQAMKSVENQARHHQLDRSTGIRLLERFDHRLEQGLRAAEAHLDQEL